MNDVVARLSAFGAVFLLLVALATLWITSKPSPGGTQVRAEFENAYPLLEGMNVRVAGAVAGSVSDVELSDQGTALITMRLHEGTEAPKTDAIASIKQEDITGDSYVSLTLGAEAEPLGEETIRTSQTMTAPRFDDLLNSFDEPVRQGVELLLVEMGIALEGRGADLNSAALGLRPAIRATDSALSEVASRNRTLKALVVDAERVSDQAAAHSDELGRLVDSLQVTLDATAAHSGAMDAALEIAPQTLVRARSTLARLTRLAIAGLPLARTLGDAAPEIVKTGERLGPFIDDAEAILDDIEPTLDATIELFVAATPTLKAAPKRALTAPFDLAGGVGGLLDSLVGDPKLQQALFGADTYGGQEEGNFADDVGLGSVAVELGSQDGYPADYDPERRFLRAIGIPSCEMFGAPIEPGCLAAVLAGAAARDAGRRSNDRGGGDGHGGQAPAPPTDAPAPGGDGGGEGGLQLPIDPDDLGDALGPVTGGGGGNGPLKPGKPGRPSGEEIDELLDFLLGP